MPSKVPSLYKIPNFCCRAQISLDINIFLYLFSIRFIDLVLVIIIRNIYIFLISNLTFDNLIILTLTIMINKPISVKIIFIKLWLMMVTPQRRVLYIINFK